MEKATIASVQRAVKQFTDICLSVRAKPSRWVPQVGISGRNGEQIGNAYKELLRTHPPTPSKEACTVSCDGHDTHNSDCSCSNLETSRRRISHRLDPKKRTLPTARKIPCKEARTPTEGSSVLSNGSVTRLDRGMYGRHDLYVWRTKHVKELFREDYK